MTKTHCFSGKISQTKEQKQFYNTFKNIQARCNKQNHKSYKDYWWRWIKCEWECFEDFRDDLWGSFKAHVSGYWLKDTTIDRIDNDWNYCKSNCKWSTREEQGRNKRYNRVYLIDGKKYMAEDLSRELWIWHWAAAYRLKKYVDGKMSKERLFAKEGLKQERKKYNVEWKRYDVYRLMEECGISIVTAENRLRHYQAGKCWLNVLLHKWKITNIKKFTLDSKKFKW